MSSDDAVADEQTAIIQRSSASGDIFSPEKDIFLLPSVEQMQMDVANATFELQKAYIPGKKQDETIDGLGVENLDSLVEEVLESGDNLPELLESDNTEDPSQRTREETISEELLIDGKRYRHTYQRRVVLERQKTREVFVLPTSTASLKPPITKSTEKECASSLTNCNRSLDRNFAAKSGGIGGDRGSYGMRLDLSVQNQDGGFSPVVVLLPESEPGTPHFTTDYLKKDTATRSEQGLGKLDNQELDDGLSDEPPRTIMLERPTSVLDASLKPEPSTGIEIEPAVPTENYCDTPPTPLLFSHMYHFGKWDMTAPILDPRLPAGITQRGSDAAELAFSVSPAEWHQTDISYGDTSGGNSMHTSHFGTVAKGRIVACLQRFTQKSARTGRHLYRSTYVQHTKIARWRSTNKETEPQSPQELHSPEHKSQFSTSAPEDSVGSGLFNKQPNGVSTLEGIWKQGARAGESLATTSPHLTPVCTILDACSYDRLQLLQSICPAAAAATVILGRQIPDMRRSPGPVAQAGQPASAAVGESPSSVAPIFTVSADAWCPRELMMLEAPPDALIFMSPATHGGKRGGNEVTGVDDTTAGPPNLDQSTGQSARHECLLRGGTLDGLLVYALKILRERQTEFYESLVPDIFLKLYSTFTTVNEVACRLMQRYIAFAPIEPGGLGCLVDGEQHSAEGAWMEALNTARFLVKVLSEAASDEFSSQFMLKIVHYARVLQMDSKSAQKRASSDGPINANWINGLKENDAPDVEIPVMRDQTASSEQDTEDTCIEPLPKQLKDLANKLLLLIPYSAGGLKVTGETGVNKCRVRVPAEKTATSSVPAGPINYCSCQERLHKFLHFDTQEIAEQITLNEEAHFQKIDLKEFIAIKRLMQGNTPTLSNCVKHFNDVSAWVKVLLRMANEYGCPWRQSFSSSNSSTIPLPEASIDQNNFSIKTRDHQSPQNNAVICQVCGLPQQLRPRKPPGGSPTNGFYFRLQSRPCESGFEIKSASSSDSYSKTRNYLCMTVGSQNLSLRGKKQNLLLENVLWNLCCVAEELKKMNNFSSFLALILGIQNASLPKVSKKIKSKLTEFGAYMVPPAFTTYRHDLESAKMPCLPYLGLIFQQLIHLDSGNALFLPSQTQPDENDTAPGETTSALITDDEKDSQKIVNYWRCWKHYLILGYFMKRLQLSEENCQIMSSTLQWNDVVDNGSLLYKSYTAGCESPHYQNVSPQPPVAGTPTKGLSSSQTPESLHSLVRFRTQAKDQFVVRVVKITDKSSSLNPSNKQESLSASPRLDVFDQESVQLRLNQSGDGVFVGFQAQMPAMSSVYVSRSTSADQVGNERSCPSHSQRRRKVGKGVRICFSCLLKGNGPQIQEFYKGVVAQRLEAWEKSSGRSGILLEVLTALRLTVENMLKQIRLDGLRTILPEEDYVFYPLRSDELQPVYRYSRKASFSTDCLEGKALQRLDLNTEPSSPVPLWTGSCPYPSPQSTSNPIAVPTQGQPLEHRKTLPSTSRRNHGLLSALSNSRPVSAYGTIFGNTGKGLASEMHCFLSASGMSPQSKALDQSAYGSIHRNEHSHSPQMNRLSPDFCPNCLMCDSPCGTSEISGKLYASQTVNEFPVYGREGEYLPIQTIGQCTGQAYSPNGSQRTMPPSMQQSADNPLDLGLLETTSLLKRNKRNWDYDGLFAIDPEGKMQPTSSNQCQVIKEITERLRSSPHLPLVVMPTQSSSATPGVGGDSPSPALTDKLTTSPLSTGVPLVFQLSNPDVIFVGLPAVGSDRPRLVTSPSDSAFVVASKRTDEVHLPQQTQTLPPAARYTVASPKPGYLLAVSSEGSVYQIPENYNVCGK